jgi:Mg-chelatase subunit ChlD
MTAFSAQLIAGSSGAAIATEAEQPKERPQMDVAFCIDTTGSMQAEIDVVKSKTKELVAKLSSGKPAPNIRVGLVAFRDRDDDYVTKVYQFTGDIDKIVKDISNLQANGGGDSPEAVDEGLHSSVNDLHWSTDKKTVKLLFLIGDAGPHAKGGARYDWLKESKDAIAKGIQINTIACEGLQSFPEAQGRNVFEQIAKVTDGKFENLAYRQEVATADGKKETLISSGGARYKMKAGSDASAWRGGVGSLSAKGMLAPVTASAPALRASKRAMDGYASSAAAESGFYADAAAPVARADNNLADVLLQGAREAVRKSAK